MIIYDPHTELSDYVPPRDEDSYNKILKSIEEMPKIPNNGLVIRPNGDRVNFQRNPDSVRRVERLKQEIYDEILTELENQDHGENY